MRAHRRLAQLPAPVVRLAALVLGAALGGCQAPSFPERAEVLPAEALGSYVTTFDTTLPAAAGATLDEASRARLDDLLDNADGAAAARALIEVAPADAAFGARVAAYLAAREVAAQVVAANVALPTVILQRVDVVASRCPDLRTARLAHPLDPLLGNPNPVNDLGFGCANAANLDAMADPAQLGALARTGPAVSPSAVGAVRRYYQNEVTPLADRSPTEAF